MSFPIVDGERVPFFVSHQSPFNKSLVSPFEGVRRPSFPSFRFGRAILPPLRNRARINVSTLPDQIKQQHQNTSKYIKTHVSEVLVHSPALKTQNLKTAKNQLRHRQRA